MDEDVSTQDTLERFTRGQEYLIVKRAHSSVSGDQSLVSVPRSAPL